MAIATLLWGCRVAEPIKVPLTTTKIGSNRYASPSLAQSAAGSKHFYLTEENPTEKFTLDGIACTVRVELSAKGATDKLILKTPTREFIFTNATKDEPLELTLDNGQKYFFNGEAYSYTMPSDDGKKITVPCGVLDLASALVGKIGETPITLLAPDYDGGIIIGTPKNSQIVQPLSKYIRIPPPTDGIFEILNIAKDGSEMTIRPYNGPTATIEAHAPQGYSGAIVLTSADTGLNVTLSGKAGEAVSVIPGSYTLRGATLNTTNGSWMEVSGEGLMPMKVEPGGKQAFVLSGPKTLEFQAEMSNGRILDPKTAQPHPDSSGKILYIKQALLQMKGQAGETYTRLSDFELGGRPPEVYINVDGKMTLLGKMEFG